MPHYDNVPEETKSEILAGAGGGDGNKAEVSIAFLEEWSNWIVEFINIFKNFFDRIKEAFAGTEE